VTVHIYTPDVTFVINTPNDNV